MDKNYPWTREIIENEERSESEGEQVLASISLGL